MLFTASNDKYYRYVSSNKRNADKARQGRARRCCASPRVFAAPHRVADVSDHPHPRVDYRRSRQRLVHCPTNEMNNNNNNNNLRNSKHVVQHQ